MSGKMSKIRMKSNKSYGKYNLDGTLKTNKMSKSQLERYLKEERIRISEKRR